jgi:hypothetical protein
MIDKLIIPFDGKKESDIDTDGEFTSTSFEWIRRLLIQHCDLDDDEQITGFVITKEGIKIRIDTK